MKTLITSRRRKLTKSARKHIDRAVRTWRDRTGAWSSNEMMGLGIRAAVLRRYLIAYAETHDAFAAGVHRIQNDSQYGIGSLRIDLDGPDGMRADVGQSFATIHLPVGIVKMVNFCCSTKMLNAKKSCLFHVRCARIGLVILLDVGDCY